MPLCKSIGNKLIVEHLIDNNEKTLRTLTSATNHLSLAAALADTTPVLLNMVDQHALAKLYYDPAAPAAEGGRAAKTDDEPPKGDGLGCMGPGGAFSRKQMEQMRRQANASPYSGGKGGGKGGGGGWWGGGGGGGGWQGGGGGWQGGGGSQGGSGWQGGGKGGGKGGGGYQGGGGGWQAAGGWQGGGQGGGAAGAVRVVALQLAVHLVAPRPLPLSPVAISLTAIAPVGPTAASRTNVRFESLEPARVYPMLSARRRAHRS